MAYKEHNPPGFWIKTDCISFFTAWLDGIEREEDGSVVIFIEGQQPFKLEGLAAMQAYAQIMELTEDVDFE